MFTLTRTEAETRLQEFFFSAALVRYEEQEVSRWENFHALYEKLEIVSFGRTAKFDLLCLLGNLGFLLISPGHCFLRGAAGPRAGATLMITGRKKGRLTPEIETTVRLLTNISAFLWSV
jgi:hypothetical protein